jgi:hypothetical protein
MGNSTTKELTPVQKDIKYLGDRFPFGDKELHNLYEAYHAIAERKSFPSFLQDWSVECSGEDAKQEREILIQVIESKILPPGLGNRLFETAFVAPGDASVYSSNSNNADASMDEHTRISRLEAIFQGISNSGRRGAKESLKVLFGLCTKKNNNIQAYEFVSIGYRLALASAFLKAAAIGEDDEVDMSVFIPAQDDDETQLQALANSILARAKDRRRAFTNESDEQEEGWVDMEDILEWSDAGESCYKGSC